MKTKYLSAIILIISIVAVTNLESRSKRVSQIPNAVVFSCATCHISENDLTRNAFGNAVFDKFLTSKNSNGNVIWGPALAALDADGDGASNGLELGDPNGTWKTGDASPGDQSKVTNPGDPSSKPSLNSVISELIGSASSIFDIMNVYPNPAENSTTVSFTLNTPSNVRIDVINSNGNLISGILQNQYLGNGEYSYNWDLTNTNGQKVSAGVYLIRITSAGSMISQKIVVK